MGEQSQVTVEDQHVEAWSPASTLSERVQRLREHFFSFHERSLTDEPYAFTTGTPWDEVCTFHDWSNDPALYLFMPSVSQDLRAMAIRVELPDDHWNHTLAMRRAVFIHEVMTHHMPVEIPDGELIVGFDFNTALSRSLNEEESKRYRREVSGWFDEASRLNELGVGTVSAAPGHIIPNYAKVLRIGLRGIMEEYEEILQRKPKPEHREFVEALILSLRTAAELNERYARKADRLAERETDLERRAELEEIVRICRKVPWDPPDTFWEALQALRTEPAAFRVKGVLREINSSTAYVGVDRVYAASLPRPGVCIDVPMVERTD